MNFSQTIMARIQNMALYFVEHTLDVNQLKLDKLFFFVDYAFCQDYGVSISEQPYVARKRGPVPVAAGNFGSLFYTYQLGQVIVPDEAGFYSKAPDKFFNRNFFSPKQLDLLEKISTEYYATSGDEMSTKTHQKGSVWDKTWQNGSGEENEIDLIDKSSLNSEIAKRYELFRNRLSLSRKAFSELGI